LTANISGIDEDSDKI